MTCIVLCASAVWYGATRGSHELVNLNPWLGMPSTAAAKVETVKVVTHGISMTLDVTDIAVGGPNIPVKVRVSFATFQPSAALLGMQPGTQVLMRGTFALPQVITSKGVPLRAELQKAGIRYVFIGTVIPVRVSRKLDISTRFGELHKELVEAGTSVMAGSPLHDVNLDMPLLDSIIFGSSDLSPNVKQAFLQAGLLHILAASGANVLLIEMSVGLVLRSAWRWLRVPAFFQTCAMLATVWVFAGLCNFSVSIVRAACMSSYRIIGQATGRSVSSYSSIAIAAVFVVVVTPATFSTPSAALSFSATLAVYLAARSQGRPQVGQVSLWTKFLRYVFRAFRTTLVVELVIVPLTVCYFGQMTPFSLVSNVAAEPVVTVLLPLSALFLSLSLIATHVVFLVPPVMWLGTLAFFILDRLMWFVNTVATWPYSLLTFATPPWYMVASYYLLLVAVVFLWKKVISKWVYTL